GEEEEWKESNGGGGRGTGGGSEAIKKEEDLRDAVALAPTSPAPPPSPAVLPPPAAVPLLRVNPALATDPALRVPQEPEQASISSVLGVLKSKTELVHVLEEEDPEEDRRRRIRRRIIVGGSGGGSLDRKDSKASINSAILALKTSSGISRSSISRKSSTILLSSPSLPFRIFR
ncbi:unnamed protein product, partial [Nesidiocoris tenuis]